MAAAATKFSPLEKRVKDHMSSFLLQTFLDSLIGETVAEAESRVNDWGFKPWTVKEGSAIGAIAKPGVVILGHNTCKIVTEATAGDPLQVVHDC